MYNLKHTDRHTRLGMGGGRYELEIKEQVMITEDGTNVKGPVFQEAGLSLGWSVIRVVFHQGFLSPVRFFIRGLTVTIGRKSGCPVAFQDRWISLIPITTCYVTQNIACLYINWGMVGWGCLLLQLM